MNVRRLHNPGHVTDGLLNVGHVTGGLLGDGGRVGMSEKHRHPPEAAASTVRDIGGNYIEIIFCDVSQEDLHSVLMYLVSCRF